MNRIFNKLGPRRLLVLGFASVIFIGAILLTLPIASETGTTTDFLTALFTATSAVCVTGLVLVDTSSHWSVFGETIIMLMIQVGGLGIMTFAALFALLLGKKIGLRERLILQESLNKINVSGVVRLVRQILLITLTIEGIGAIILFLRFLKEMPLSKAAFYGIFHSISAFNNAGFDLFGILTGKFSSLTSFTSDSIVTLTISSLFIIGGLGFIVVMQLSRTLRFKEWDLHTKTVLSVTAFLLGLSFVAIIIVEWSNPNTLGQLSWGDKILAALFQSATPRTAGFNTLDTAALRIPTQFLVIVLMFIGASPGSTGGGIKTTTFATYLSSTKATLQGKEDTTAFERRIPKELVSKASAILFISLSWVILVTFLLSISEQADFLTTLFETTSAFGTVGLSMGLTTSLSTTGKILIMLTMFLGRLGPLTLMYSIAKVKPQAKIRYPEDNLLVG